MLWCIMRILIKQVLVVQKKLMHYLLTPNSIMFNAIIASFIPRWSINDSSINVNSFKQHLYKNFSSIVYKRYTKKTQYVYILIAISRFKEVNYMSKAFQTETYWFWHTTLYVLCQNYYSSHYTRRLYLQFEIYLSLCCISN